MKDVTITELIPNAIRNETVGRLVALWKQSVLASHTFLSAEEVERIQAVVPDAIKSVEHLLVVQDSDGDYMAFCGWSGESIEVLFVAPQFFGCGLGRRLVDVAISRGAVGVTVNEQNPKAVAFYEHLGFRTYVRSPTDDYGNSYPILHMRLEKPENPVKERPCITSQQ